MALEPSECSVMGKGKETTLSICQAAAWIFGKSKRPAKITSSEQN
ncbi:hypothetical protein DFR59_11683 [Falsibacillus pallidus]|uniref:Uncharacterized protein n=1 Tax=Falsibacillus pallidus TaxID=493781 RepID=A0A370G999_9BACI|nr:hypothetical protein DFR59_11683 [Falsibacillus pallidus]